MTQAEHLCSLLKETKALKLEHKRLSSTLSENRRAYHLKVSEMEATLSEADPGKINMEHSKSETKFSRKWSFDDGSEALVVFGQGFEILTAEA